MKCADAAESQQLGGSEVEHGHRTCLEAENRVSGPRQACSSHPNLTLQPETRNSKLHIPKPEMYSGFKVETHDVLPRADEEMLGWDGGEAGTPSS